MHPIQININQDYAELFIKGQPELEGKVVLRVDEQGMRFIPLSQTSIFEIVQSWFGYGPLSLTNIVDFISNNAGAVIDELERSDISREDFFGRIRECSISHNGSCLSRKIDTIGLDTLNIPSMDVARFQKEVKTTEKKPKLLYRYAINAEIKKLAPNEQINIFKTYLENIVNKCAANFEEGIRNFRPLQKRILARDLSLTNEDIFTFDRPWIDSGAQMGNSGMYLSILKQIQRENPTFDFSEDIEDATRIRKECKVQQACYRKAVDWAWNEFHKITD